VGAQMQKIAKTMKTTRNKPFFSIVEQFAGKENTYKPILSEFWPQE